MRRIKKISLLLLVGLVIVVVLMAVTVVTVPAVASKLGIEPLLAGMTDSSAKEEPKEFGPIVQAGDYTVNLQGDSSFLRVQISLELADKKAEEELKNLMPIVKDQVIDVIATKTVADVKNPAGKDGLRKELLEKLNQALGGSKVKNVLFTSYVYQ